MRCVQRFILIILITVFFCFPGHTVLTMAKEKVPDSEQTYLLTTETTSKYQLSSSELLAQSEPGTAGSDTDAGTSEADEEAQIAEALAKPLSYLWLMFMQNDTMWYDGDILDRLGEDTKVMNTTLIMPVLSMQLTEKWKTIFRPVIPIYSFETVDNLNVSVDNVGEPTIGVDFERETGLGDIVLWTAFSKQYKPPFVWGLGPTVMLDTATNDQLGTG